MPNAPKPTNNLHLTARDRAVLIGLFEARVFTLKQLAKLYFEDRYEMTKKRLQKLKAAGYVRALNRAPFQPSALVLAKKGFLAVRHAEELARYPEIPWNTFYKRTQIADSTLRHELAVSEVRVALLSTIRERNDLELLELTTWPWQINFEARFPVKRDGFTYKKAMTIRPDGLLRLKHRLPNGSSRDLTFYLEIDRSTESQTQLLKKASGYIAHRNQEPFQVIFTFSTIARCREASSRIHSMKEGRLFILTLGESEILNEHFLSSLGRKPQVTL